MRWRRGRSSQATPGWPRASATPAGFEGARDHAKPSETEPAPTENAKSGSVTHIVARRGCSKCSKAAHLALVAANAVRNGDLYRALEILEGMAGSGLPRHEGSRGEGIQG
jgi:hypothetical protein